MTTMASRTRLPPSPELNAMTGTDALPLLSLSDQQQQEQPQPPRLRSVARYASYRPQTLATSEFLPSIQTSLGAVAGSHGVAIFRVSEPTTPLALMNHSSPGIGPLCFQPDPQCLLAGSRGSAVLIWDVVAAQILSDRCEAAADTISSLTWRNPHVLAASTSSTACVWDMRQSNRTKPTIRFGAHPHTENQPYVQIASREHQVALLDSAGLLRIWDWRYIEEGASKMVDTIVTMEAFRSVGVGLLALPSASWITWGYDRINEAAVAKVFAPKTVSAAFATAVGEIVTQESMDDTGDAPYAIAGMLQTPDLACARVQGDHIVTLGVSADRWRADVWKVEPDVVSVDPVVSFYSSRNLGRLCAADLAFSTFPRMVEEGVQGSLGQRTSGLMLVNLTEEGYVTTHSIPEAMESIDAKVMDAVKQDKATNTSINSTARVIPEVRELGDVAGEWRNKADTPDDVRTSDDLPFDMDVPVAYSIPSSDVQQLRRGDMAPASGATSGTGVPDNVDHTPVRLQIDTRQIPCPRLCGATFGPGGLAVFGNGEVTRLWAWYSSLVGRQENELPSLRKTVSFDEKRGLRTMHDLQMMVKAAKDAQWGEQSEVEESSVSSQHLGLGFFEDDSEDESTDSAEQDPDELGFVTAEKTKTMYDSYFGDFRSPLSRASSIESKLANPTSESGETLGGPTSDVLAPVVKVSRSFDKIAMHNQSRELALKWRLGDIEVQSSLSTWDKKSHAVMGFGPTTVPSALYPPRLSLLPGVRLLGQPSGNIHSRVLPTTPGALVPKNDVSKHAYDVDEAGVHGGEYSVRPNMKESVVFLRKLVNYQQESGGTPGSSEYRGLMSPPDGPMQHRSTRASRLPQPSSPSKQGAYVLRRSQPDNSDLEAIKHVCEHNSTVASDANEPEKAETWRLLAQVVAGRMNVVGGPQWKPKASSAMGSSLVQLVLKYYERVGDVQMLSTIVSVLRQGKGSTSKGVGTSLLPEDIDGRLDCYLRRYADLLYSWGLLSLRAQLNKRLQYVYESREVFGVPSAVHQGGGIAIFSECPNCHQPTTQNYCNACSDYAFRCTICDTAVRGLFTVCSDCGHGGHIAHLHDWFLTNDACPTGCGCQCALMIAQSEQPRLAVNQ